MHICVVYTTRQNSHIWNILDQNITKIHKNNDIENNDIENNTSTFYIRLPRDILLFFNQRYVEEER